MKGRCGGVIGMVSLDRRLKQFRATRPDPLFHVGAEAGREFEHLLSFPCRTRTQQRRSCSRYASCESHQKYQ